MRPDTRHAVQPLSVFTFLWAGPALVHQEYYEAWYRDGNLFGWMLTIFAMGWGLSALA